MGIAIGIHVVIDAWNFLTNFNWPAVFNFDVYSNTTVKNKITKFNNLEVTDW